MNPGGWLSALPIMSGSRFFILTHQIPPDLFWIEHVNCAAAVTGKVSTLNNGVAIVELYETP